MAENCKIIYKEGMGELVEKKSRFIAQIRPVKSEEEALAFVEETRKKYWDARHNCYAYILKGEGATPTARCSDDGEPQIRLLYQERTAMCFFTSAVLLTFHKYAVKQKPVTTIALLL